MNMKNEQIITLMGRAVDCLSALCSHEETEETKKTLH
jgi:hypothetical protein